MPKSSAIWCVLLLAIPAQAQWPAHPRDAGELAEKFSSGFRGEPLDCSVDLKKPFLDFAFRFEAGLIVDCPINQFGGEEARLTSLIRIRPEGADPVFLVDVFHVPGAPDNMRRRIDFRRLQSSAEFSQVFALGEGKYPVDLVVLDSRGRVFRKSWTAHASAHGDEKNANVSLKPNSAMSAVVPPWNWRPDEQQNGLHLTVMLDAAPIFPNAQKLRAWDRAFLLDSLSSLLREVPSVSLRLIAFNLDQQQIVFQEDEFDHGGFRRLSRALESLELGTISYQKLRFQGGWTYLLAKLVNDEAANAHPADAVIFIGPRNRLLEKTPREMLDVSNSHAPFFYFEYIPGWGDGFPDAIHSLVSECNGTVLKLHSPGEFAEGIKKLQNRLKQPTRDAAP